MKKILIENEIVKIDSELRSIVGNKIDKTVNRDNALYSIGIDILIAIAVTDEDGVVLTKIKRGGRLVH